MIRRCENCKYGYEGIHFDDDLNIYADDFWCKRFPQWIEIDDKINHFCGEWRSEYE